MSSIAKSATRLILIYLAVWLPVLVWFGKVSSDKYSEALLVVLGAFFGSKIVENGGLSK